MDKRDVRRLVDGCVSRDEVEVHTFPKKDNYQSPSTSSTTSSNAYLAHSNEPDRAAISESESFRSVTMFRPIILQRFSALPLSTTRSFSASTRSNLARMTIVGRLGAEPERVNTSTGKDIIRYVIGSNSGSRENQKTSWFKVTSFDENEARVNHLLSLQKG
ncbi:MAG: hypothetical protein Q9157_006176, partial [Trypethelium eluteriae]